MTIQQSSFVHVSGEWDNDALMGLENVQMMHDIERTDNGVVDIATINALISNAQKKIEYYDEHPTMKKVNKVMGDFFSNGVGEMVESFDLSIIGSRVFGENKPSSTNRDPGLKVDEGAGKVNPLKVNNEALDHANLGDFTRNPKTGEISKMSGGGHGQDNIAFLEKNGIEYNIELTYPNGVRVGNVPGHKSKGKRTGTGQAWFPETWTKEDISKAGEYIANMPGHVNVADGVTIW